MIAPFVSHEGTAALITQDHVNTDVIIPMESVMWVARADLGPHAFAPMRYLADGSPDPTFGWNAPFEDMPTILVCGANFGCGSSREAAVQAIEALGIRALIGTTFGDIFYGNCVKNGILPACLSVEDHGTLMRRLEAMPVNERRIRVRLAEMDVSTPGAAPMPFVIGEPERERLAAGGDEVDVTLSCTVLVERFRERDRTMRPWAWPDHWNRPDPTPNRVDLPANPERDR